MTLTISKQTARRYLLGRQGLWPGRRWKAKPGAAKPPQAPRPTPKPGVAEKTGAGAGTGAGTGGAGGTTPTPTPTPTR